MIYAISLHTILPLVLRTLNTERTFRLMTSLWISGIIGVSQDFLDDAVRLSIVYANLRML